MPSRPAGPLVRVPPPWTIDSRDATPEATYLRRREVLGLLGLGTIGAFAARRPHHALAQDGARPPTAPHPPAPPDVRARYPARRADAFAVDRPVTPEHLAGGYNNFYEHTTDKRRVAALARRFESRPWTVEVAGLCAKPGVFDVDDLQRRFPLEERVYRFRCVEAWSMVVPWTGLPLARLLDAVAPKAEARFVRFVSFERPSQALGQRTQRGYPWPYFEGLRLDEAAHPLTLLATGIYGHPLPNQHGAPVRLVVPWKYGYKSAKAIVRIELVRDQPPTFWNQLAPSEYDFPSNVLPDVAHPRWSQRTERDLATGRRVPTRPFNGYAEDVAPLYRQG